MEFLKELEDLRSSIIKKSVITTLIFLAITIVVMLVTEMVQILFFGFVFGLLIGNLVVRKDIKNYREIYKSKIVLATFQEIFTDIHYDMNRGLDRSVIANTQMMYMGDRYHSNDLMSAKYKGINFVSADVHIEEQDTDSDGNTTYYTIFRGQWFIFDFNKQFKANIQVCESSFMGARRGGLFSGTKYNKVELEDIDFNKRFKTFAENDFDAFYVLTPNTMEKIKKLADNTNGNLLFCFIDNKLHIGLHNHRDLFEPSVFKKINLEEEKQKILGETKIITDFVDTLNLDNDLFKRSV